jgi:O-antigen ligase
MRYYIHNAYLWVWVDMGLVGLIPFVWLLAQVLVRGFGRWRKVGDPRWRAVALGVTLGILGQAITNIVAPNFIQSWGLVVFPILLGVNELIFRWELTDIPERGIPC